MGQVKTFTNYLEPSENLINSWGFIGISVKNKQKVKAKQKRNRKKGKRKGRCPTIVVEKSGAPNTMIICAHLIANIAIIVNDKSNSPRHIVICTICTICPICTITIQKSIAVHAMWTQSQLCVCAPQNWCIPAQNNKKSRTNCLSWNKSSNLSLININIRIKTLIKNLNQNCTCEYG